MSAATSAFSQGAAQTRDGHSIAWRLGDDFRRASLAIAGVSALLAAYLFWLGDPRPAFLALIGGVGLGITIGRVAHVLPRALDAPLTGAWNVWTAFVFWHGGVSMLALAWRELVPPAAGAIAGIMLAISAVLLLDRLVRMLLASPRRLSSAWKLGLALLSPAGLCAAATGIMLGLSFRAGSYGGLPDIALSLLVFGSLLPAGLVAVMLRTESKGWRI